MEQATPVEVDEPPPLPLEERNDEGAAPETPSENDSPSPENTTDSEQDSE